MVLPYGPRFGPVLCFLRGDGAAIWAPVRSCPVFKEVMVLPYAPRFGAGLEVLAWPHTRKCSIVDEGTEEVEWE